MRSDGGSFVQAIRDIVLGRRIELLLPVTEASTKLVAERRSLFPETCKLTLPDTECLQLVNDKRRIVELASKRSIPVPRTIVVESSGTVLNCIAMTFPMVIKPSRSRVFTETGLLSGGVDYACDADQLKAKLRKLPKEVYPVLLQERIVGPGVGLFACYDHGKPIALFCHQRLREKPPSGGVSVLSESIALDREAAEFAQRILTELRWHGVAMVEFKRNLRDGALYLMEINGRFWGSLQLAIDAGVDFPALLATIATGGRLHPPVPYRVGLRLRWWLGDLDALIAILLRSAGTLNLPPDHPGKLKSLTRFLAPKHAGQRNEVLRLEDPLPAFLEFVRWLVGR